MDNLRDVLNACQFERARLMVSPSVIFIYFYIVLLMYFITYIVSLLAMTKQKRISVKGKGGVGYMYLKDCFLGGHSINLLWYCLGPFALCESNEGSFLGVHVRFGPLLNPLFSRERNWHKLRKVN